MTVEDAHAIQLALPELEFPKTFSISVFFALFKTYGIPSISKLLVATGQLSSPETASKRAADTGVIITEVVLNKPDSERTISGIALMNYLHGRYIKAGKISNDDMLYTLSLFVLEPIRWTAKYEWRCVTNLERCAMGICWKDLGEKMNISYDKLPSASSGWKDGFHWLEELEAWSLAYEAKNMVPAESNATLARGTFDIALFNVPAFLKPYGYSVASCLLEPRLQAAMKYVEAFSFAIDITNIQARLPQPPATYSRLLNTLVELRKFALRNFFLPRPYFMRVKWFTALDKQTGRAHFCRYTAYPWYIRPSLSARWGPKALLLRLIGGIVPGEEKYFPDGYRIHELGPSELVGKGDAEMSKTREELRARRTRCVFSR
jgi:hypothetical protein